MCPNCPPTQGRPHNNHYLVILQPPPPGSTTTIIIYWRRIASLTTRVSSEMDGDERTAVKLVSREGDMFEVPVEIAKLSKLVVTMLGEDDDDGGVAEIPLPNVTAAVLAKVIEFCTHYKKVEASEYSFFPL